MCDVLENQRFSILDTIAQVNKIKPNNKFEATEKAVQLSKKLYELENIYKEYFKKCNN